MSPIFQTSLRAAVAVTLGLSAMTAAAGPAGASAHSPVPAPVSAPVPAKPAISPADLAAMARQAPLVDAASVIRTAVRTAPPRGYAGLSLVDDHVALYWNGKVPADINRVVGDARRLAPVTVEVAPFSQTELKSAAGKVRAATNSPAVHGVRAKNDGSGLEVVAEPGAALPALPDTGVPVRTIRQAKPTPVVNRQDDQPPWSSGMIMWGAVGGCTSGFGVKNVTTGTPYLLTAEHCGPIGTTWEDGAGEHIGTTVATNHNHDTGLISAAAVNGRVFTGTVTDGVQSPVSGPTGVFVGQSLCQSGYTSANETGGPICGLIVESISDDWQNFVSARRPDHQDGTRHGDSGGPVYQVTANGSVLAVGITSWMGGEGLMGFQDWETIRADLGDIVPVTSTLAGTPTGPCRVSYQITDKWSGGYTANVTVYNSSAAITGWNLKWNLGTSSTVTSPWRARVTQTGGAVSAVGESYIADIPAAGAVSFGFNASGTPFTPNSFTLNGTLCGS